jgi:Icc-related predicted phosphoesterase
MAIRLISDLHLEFDDSLDPGYHGEDVLVIAGDMSPDPEQARAWLERYRAETSTPVVLVLGNHEYYGFRTMGETDDLWGSLNVPGVSVLQDSEVEVAGIRFWGGTMWTEMEGVHGLSDFSHIPGATPAVLRARHHAGRAALAAAMNDPRPIVVVTHHLPSFQCIAPQYRGSPINGGFASNLEFLVSGAQLWLHGHTHTNIDMEVAGTRVVCNPRGYVEGGRPENRGFVDGLIIETES